MLEFEDNNHAEDLKHMKVVAFHNNELPSTIIELMRSNEEKLGCELLEAKQQCAHLEKLSSR